MGNSLFLPISQSVDLLQDLAALRPSHGLKLVAAVAEENGAIGRQPIFPLNDFRWPDRSVLVVGNEFDGLSPQWLEQCDALVTIPLAPGCDSLNVAVATGILLHHMSSSYST